MEHLDLPRNPVHPPIEIPYVCKEPYDGGPFLEYLERKGWDREDVVDSRARGRSAEDVQSLLQTWFFFGLLSAVFGACFDQNSFIVGGSNGQECVSTLQLPGLMAECIEQESTLDRRTRREHEYRFSEYIAEINDIMTEIQLKDHEVLDQRLTLLFAVLIEYLLDAVPFAYGTWDVSIGEQPAAMIDYLLPGAADYLLERMENDGWCPFEINLLEKLSTSEIYFISNLDRPGPEKDHRRCDKDKCWAYQLDPATYQTRHTKPNCPCVPVYASQKRLSQILRSSQGCIPLITPYSTYVDDEGTNNIHLVESCPTEEYVAISHVWSDGLGNVNQNSIPRCQFDRLSKLVTDLYDGTPKPFWLDTLCFPLEPQKAYDLALIAMRKTYADAHKVLTLDSYLLAQNKDGMAVEEILTRVFCSPWNRRLWTLQEGFLAKSIIFQMSDSFVNISDSFNRDDEKRASLGDLTFKSMWLFYDELRASERGPEYTHHVMNAPAAKKALASRSTSVLADEALCLGNLLGLDPEMIVQTPDEDRIWRIWEEQTEYYAAVIFWQGSKLDKKGYRWAPATLFDRSTAHVQTYHYPRLPAQLSNVGLMVQFPGVLFHAPKRPIRSNFYLQDDEDVWFQLSCSRKMSGENVLDGCVIPEWEEAALEPRMMALITHDPLKRDGSVQSDLDLNAVLATVQEIDEDFIRVEMLCYVMVFKIDASQSANLNENLKEFPDTKGKDAYEDISLDSDDESWSGLSRDRGENTERQPDSSQSKEEVTGVPSVTLLPGKEGAQIEEVCLDSN
jgi:hypothetical protein